MHLEIVTSIIDIETIASGGGIRKNLSIGFAICVDTDDPDLLTPRMIYHPSTSHFRGPGKAGGFFNLWISKIFNLLHRHSIFRFPAP